MGQQPDRTREHLPAWHESILTNREEAGLLLAERLLPYRADPNALILALPRGGVVVGHAISTTLHLPLDVILTRKLGAPGNPEYAVGAVSEMGSVFLNPRAHEMLSALGVVNNYLDDAIQAERREIERRQAIYRRGRPLPDLKDRTIIVVDDGIATGATLLSAVATLKSRGVRHLIAAIPVGPGETIQLVREEVDALFVLTVPESFFAVANHYLDFSQVEDREVLHYLEAAEGALQLQHRNTES